MEEKQKKLYISLVKQVFREGKKTILSALVDKSMSLTELCEKTGMSLPLVCYHLNGNKQSNYEGLIQFGLVDCVEKRPMRKIVSISEFGLEVLEMIKSK